MSDVYISYHSQNTDYVVKLASALRGYGLTVYSAVDVMVGEDWKQALHNALLDSRFVLTILSQKYRESGFAESEWKAGLERELHEHRVIVLPLLIQECDVPKELATKARLDFRNYENDDALFKSRVTDLVNAIRRQKQPPKPPDTPPSTPKSLETTPPLQLPPLSVPSDLIQSCMTGDCVLFAGAGLSARAGVPTWNHFLFDLLEFALKHNVIDSGYAQSLKAALNEGERDAAADGIVQMFGNQRELLQSFLIEYFQNAGPIAPAHTLLQQIPFSSIITTNYDRLLEETYPEFAKEGIFTPKEAEPLLNALSQKRPFILKLYGLIERLETLIFAPIEYREALSSNISFSKFMEGIFFSRTFFFVGLGLEGIQDFLSGFVFRGISPRKHFALVAVTGSAWKAKAELLQRRYNIEVIPFPVSETFPELETFLQDLVHAVRPVLSETGATTTPTPLMPGLRKLVLEDIGPFERLELDFPPVSDPSRSEGFTRWKILLGDNGVGKSTILKAIAVAIMGNDARSFAARLVRAGKTKGRITLYTEHNPASGFITEILTKDMASEAEIISLPTRPMEAEGWLALGFSPLRVVTWASSTGPQPIVQKGRPTADDLLPLVSGESDPRMDRLKQWIVNLDSVDKPGRPRVLSGHEGRVTSLVFAPDGRTLISGSIDGTIRFWDCVTGSQTKKIDAHTAGINSIALSGDGRMLASGSYDRRAKTWKVSTGDHIQTFKGSHSQIFSVALDLYGTTLITGSESGSVRIWSADGRELHNISGDGSGAWTLSLSPDGETIACGSYRGTIRLSQVATGTYVRSIEVGRGVVMSLAWLPDGKHVVSGSRNGPVNIWDVTTSLETQEFPGADTRTVAISPDGLLIAAGFDNGDIKVWDAASGQELMNTQAHPQAVWSVAFSPDGRTLASASEDRTIKLWTIPGTIPSGNQQETIRRFFRLIGVLTDRHDIDYAGVTDDYRVMVKVADAATDVVPLELLSQGMTSLFGWIGVLCQRLKETLQLPTQEPLPTNSYALVLIDELDAHMHPRWQQVLVHRLKKSFPNVQFIACTHSPLIAGGLAKDEVDRFTIRKRKIVKVEFDPDMTLGRFDQILTGELFGLETTLDPVTQALIAEYEDLLGEPERNEAQENRFQQLGRELEERIPPTPSNLVERRAGELLEAWQSPENGDKQARVEERISRLAKAMRGDA